MLQTLFYPKSIAILGVSKAPANLGRMIVENLERFGFQGDVYPVNDKGGEVKGRKIYRSIEETGVAPDLVILLIPAKKVPEALDEAGRMGTRYAIIESGGFTEFDDDRRGLEEEILARAKKRNITFMGPNCIGIINRDNGLITPFVPFYPKDIKMGSLSIISQSGGLVHDLIMFCGNDGVGLNKLVSMGNKLMVDENDFLEYLISDPSTRTIGLYLEDFTNGRRFTDLALSTDKPIVVLKANASPASREVAGFHTAALAGDDAVVDAAFRHAGVHRVLTLQELVETLKVFELQPVKGRRIGLVTRSGGHAVLAADSAHRYGFSLPGFSDEFFRFIEPKRKAGIIRMTNPLDIGDIFAVEFYAAMVDKILQEQVDGVVFIHSYNHENEGQVTADFIQSLAPVIRKYGKPVVFCLIANKEQWFPMRDLAGFPVFTEVDAALKALSKSLDHYEFQIGKRVSIGPVDAKGGRKEAVLSRASTMLDPDDAFTLLKSYGLPVADYRVATGLDQALLAAQEIGYPVALKTASPLVLHKTDVGAIKLNVMNEKELKDAWEGMKAEKCLIQRMSPPGHEVIVGGKKDGEFGQVILLGLGGIFVEVFKDVAMRLVPIDEDVARQMVEEIKGGAILKGLRGQRPGDMDAVVQFLMRVSELLAAHPGIRNLDINPLIVFEKGQGSVAVDVKIEVEIQ